MVVTFPNKARTLGAESQSPSRCAPSAGDLAWAWLEADPSPRLICTSGLALIWANAAARTVLAAGGELELRDGALNTHERALQDDLEELIKRAAVDAFATAALPRTDGDGHLLLRASAIRTPTSPDAAEVSERPDYIGIAFRCSRAGDRPPYADLDAAFGLTPAEHRVLLRMTEGLTAEAVAEAMEVSIETVRSHIRQLYHKIGVASREALFAKIAPFRL